MFYLWVSVRLFHLLATILFLDEDSISLKVELGVFPIKNENEIVLPLDFGKGKVILSALAGVQQISSNYLNNPTKINTFFYYQEHEIELSVKSCSYDTLVSENKDNSPILIVAAVESKVETLLTNTDITIPWVKPIQSYRKIDFPVTNTLN